MGVESWNRKKYCDPKTSWTDPDEDEACRPMSKGGFEGAGWRVENLRVSAADGSMVWRTVDQFNPPSEEPLAYWENSASEYIAVTPDGGLIALTDNDSGMGFLRIGAPSSAGSAITTPPRPPAAPTPQRCCTALTAQCLACVEGLTEANFCLKKPETVGCLQEGPLLSSGSKTITHASVARSFDVAVPKTAGVYPVLLLLHGMGGSGPVFLDQFSKSTDPNIGALSQTHILVTPSGIDMSWNVVYEQGSNGNDDVGFVGMTLLAHLASFSNVKPVFKLLGHSNGAALTNRILIENDDRRITHAVTDVSQLNTHQYKAGGFMVGGPSNTYTTQKPNLTKRLLLQLTGAQDTLIPAQGGESGIEGLSFVPWADSAYYYASAYGFTGAKKTPKGSTDGLASMVTYLGGDVQALNYRDAGHAVINVPADDEEAGPVQRAAATAANAILRSFLEKPTGPGELSPPALNPPQAVASPATNPAAPNAPGMCCRAFTAKCLSCSEGLTVEEFCGKRPDTVGCGSEPSEGKVSPGCGMCLESCGEIEACWTGCVSKGSCEEDDAEGMESHAEHAMMGGKDTACAGNDAKLVNELDQDQDVKERDAILSQMKGGMSGKCASCLLEGLGNDKPGEIVVNTCMGMEHDHYDGDQEEQDGKHEETEDWNTGSQPTPSLPVFLAPEGFWFSGSDGVRRQYRLCRCEPWEHGLSGRA